MFAATVVVGLAYLIKEGSLPDNMCPPPGFDAVVGEVRHRTCVSRFGFSTGVDGLGWFESEQIEHTRSSS